MSKRKRGRKSGLSAATPRRTSPVDKLSHFLDRRIWWIALGLIFLGGLCCFLVFDPNLSTNGDNAYYIVLGMSLVQGKGLSVICSPGEPPAALVPLGYLLLLAPILALFPENFLLLKLLSTALFLLSLPLIMLVIRDRAEKLFLALGVAVLSAINLGLLQFSFVVMTEIPFLFFSLLGLFSLQRSLRSAGPKMTKNEKIFFGLSIFAFVFAYYIRAVGVVLLAALLAFLVLQKRYRLVLLAGLVILCLVLPWALRNQAVADGEGYLDHFMLKNSYDPVLGKVTVGDMLTRMTSNIKTYGMFVIPKALFPTLYPRTGYRGFSGILPLLGVIITLVTLVGFILKVRRSPTFIEFYTFFFMGVCIVWPQMWSGMRFIIPVVPLLIYYFLVGLWGIAGRTAAWLTPLASRALLWLVLVLMLISCLSSLVQASGRLHQYPPEWQNYFLVAQWCREHTPEGSVFVARKPSLFYLHARRPVLNYPYTADTEEMIAFLSENRVEYVILDGFTWTGTTARYLVPAVMKYKDKFQAVYGLDNPQTWVLKTMGFSPQEGGG